VYFVLAAIRISWEGMTPHAKIRCSLLGFLPQSASALTVYGTDASAELVGSRDVGVGGGLKGFNDYDNGIFQVDWAITIGTTVHYAYTFTGLSGKDISNVVFDISNDCDGDPLCVTGALIGGSPAAVDFGDFSGVTGAVKLEGIDGEEGFTYEFDSNRLPVYGHLAVKDGGGLETCSGPGASNIVCSNQLLGIGADDDINNFIARPNGAVPEPGTAVLLSGGLIGLTLARRRTR
jgi:hypothetical protein